MHPIPWKRVIAHILLVLTLALLLHWLFESDSSPWSSSDRNQHNGNNPVKTKSFHDQVRWRVVHRELIPFSDLKGCVAQEDRVWFYSAKKLYLKLFSGDSQPISYDGFPFEIRGIRSISRENYILASSYEFYLWSLHDELPYRRKPIVSLPTNSLLLDFVVVEQPIHLLPEDGNRDEETRRAFHIYATDRELATIWWIKIHGKNVSIEPMGVQPKTFILPSNHFDIELVPNGLAVVNPGRHEIWWYSYDLQLQRKWGKGGTKIEDFTGCCNPIDILWSQHGFLLTAEKGIPRIKAYDADGNWKEMVVSPDLLGDNTRILKMTELNDKKILILLSKDNRHEYVIIERIMENDK